MTKGCLDNYSFGELLMVEGWCVNQYLINTSLSRFDLYIYSHFNCFHLDIHTDLVKFEYVYISHQSVYILHQFVYIYIFQGESNETRIAVANERAHDLLK